VRVDVWRSRDSFPRAEQSVTRLFCRDESQRANSRAESSRRFREVHATKQKWIVSAVEGE
jgi:hypothetical protein